MDLRQVIQVGLPDIESQIQQLLKDNMEKIKQISKEMEDKTGVKVGMTYEVTVADIDGKGKVSLEFDMLDLAGWDHKSKIPVKVKIEKENVGAIEVQYDPAAPIGIKEIKVEKKMPGGVSQSGTIAVEGTWEKPEVKVTYGQKAETPTAGGFKGEVEQTIGLDTSRSADDLYDPEWNPRSEWAIVRGIEDIIAMTNWGVKFSGKHERETGPGEKITTGVDLTVNTDRVRSWWTDWLFSDMNEAFDRLDEQLDREAQWRRDKITAEATRLGIDTNGKTNQQIINEIKTVWNAHPEQQRPIFRNPGPRVGAVNVMPGGGTKTGAGNDQQPGVALGPQPGSGQTRSTNQQSPGWKNPYKDYANPYGDYKNPYGEYVNPYK
ncbi:MAG: hypothetical protein C4518_19015 [Desulfobacteraceae bacterium]|nr:MAG: hypothetical protein C4518_19015 [Desulfobacteraceae bacterium]